MTTEKGDDNGNANAEIRRRHDIYPYNLWRRRRGENGGGYTRPGNFRSSKVTLVTIHSN
jgi:hypothetical protein